MYKTHCSLFRIDGVLNSCHSRTCLLLSIFLLSASKNLTAAELSAPSTVIFPSLLFLSHTADRCSGVIRTLDSYSAVSMLSFSLSTNLSFKKWSRHIGAMSHYASDNCKTVFNEETLWPHGCHQYNVFEFLHLSSHNVKI